MVALSRLFTEDREFDKAIMVFKSRQSKLKQTAAIHTALGDIYAEQEDISKALESYHQALVLSPNFPEAIQGIERLDMKNHSDDEGEGDVQDDDDIDISGEEGYED